MGRVGSRDRRWGNEGTDLEMRGEQRRLKNSQETLKLRQIKRKIQKWGGGSNRGDATRSGDMDSEF